MVTASRKRRHRKAEVAREQGLAVARRLLLKGGPAAVTLVNVGQEVGMGHSNILHHFGSATNLQHDLMREMIQDLSTALGEAAVEPASGKPLSRSMVAKTFKAFGREGGGLLAAWLVLSNSTDHLKMIDGAIDELKATLLASGSSQIVEENISSIILVVALCALGDALIGKYLKTMLDLPADASETFLSDILSVILSNDPNMLNL